MPIYEYKCPACGKVIERIELTLRGNGNPIPPVCREDHGNGSVYPMKRLTSASSVHFKGSGFYETDYKEKK